MKRGQVNIRIIAILLGIMIILTSLIILMNIFIPLVKEKSKLIDVNFFWNTIKIKEVSRSLSGDIEIDIIRERGKTNISQLKFLLYDDKSNVMNFTKDDLILQELESRTYVINSHDIGSKEVEMISVVPVFDNIVGIIYNPVNIKNSPLGVTPKNNLIKDWNMQSDDDWEKKYRTTLIKDPEGNEEYAYCSKEPNPECNIKSFVISSLVPISADKSYKFSIWIKSEDKNKLNYFYAYLYDYQENLISKIIFKDSKIDNSDWVKWEGYLGPNNIEDCEKAETNGKDYCNKPDSKFVKISFGSCTLDLKDINETCFMYPKIEEVNSNIFNSIN